jgi:hypothetical protein
VSVSTYITNRFTPYQMAVTGHIFAVLFLCILVLLSWKSAPCSAFAVAVIVYILLSFCCWHFSRCPGCLKPAGHEYMFNKSSHFGDLELHSAVFGTYAKLWPDRECSDCRYQLNHLPEQEGV